MLASEALKEDLAPLQPGARTSRVALCGAGLALALVGAAIRLGLHPAPQADDGASLAFSVGGAAMAVGLLPFPYSLRAAMGLGLGSVLIVLGLRDAGPLARLLGGAPPGELARLAALSLLPAALMFRAHYRAYRPARLVLAIALLASLPFAIGAGADLANPGLSWTLRAGALLEVVALACALFGFMGTDTTGAGSVWAALLLGAGTVQIALRDLPPAAHPGWVNSLAALAAVSALIPVSFGLYQILAWALARDARRMLVKRDAAGPSPA